MKTAKTLVLFLLVTFALVALLVILTGPGLTALVGVWSLPEIVIGSVVFAQICVVFGVACHPIC